MHSEALRSQCHAMPVVGIFLTPMAFNGMKLVSSQAKVHLQPAQLGKVQMSINVGTVTGNQLVTADVSSEGMEFHD
ncbi:MAG TPA: hypothetical protein VM260_17480 [Pirellula sp.]|nr:hypothetical protein [Pirellula sp.]